MMIQSKQYNFNVSIGELLYWLFFGLLFWAKGIGLYDGQPMFKTIMVAAVLCLMGKFAVEKYSIKELISVGVIVLLSAFTYITSGDKGLLLYCLMLVGMKNVNTKYLLRFALFVWGISFVILWLVSWTHMESTMYRVAEKLGLGHIFRWSMGYAHPNVLHITYLILAALILLAVGERLNWKWYLSLVIGNIFVFLFSVSYTGVAIVFLLLIGRCYLQFRKNISALEKALIGMVFPGCVLLSLLAPIVLRGKMFALLDKALNTRLTLAKYYLKPECISLFGKRLSEITNARLTMDNSYVFGLIGYGIIPFLGLCMMYGFLIYHCLKHGKMTELLVILILAVAGLTEPFMFNTAFKNIAFLFVGEAMFESLRIRQVKEIGIWYRRNREIHVPVDKVVKTWHTITAYMKEQKRLLQAGVLVGIVAAVIVGFLFVNLPEGYVVARVHCEDISEDIVLYEEGASEYEGFRLMENFESGNEIEYFSGDIVLMERIRVISMSALLGGLLGGMIFLFGMRLLRR